MLEEEIKCLRSALELSEQATERLGCTDLLLRIETNLANGLNSVGRFVEALEHFDRVIAQAPSFAMAIGNRAHCVSWYARYLFDPGHQAIFLNESRLGLRRALEIGVENHASEGMSQWLTHLESLADWERFSPDLDMEMSADSFEEREYRLWCVKNRLFLNPLNDLFFTGIVANDVLSFPSVVVPVAESSPNPPEVFGIFNQLKQEFISARYILFQAIQESQRDSLHFADKEVKLVEMLDYRHYRLWVEMAKMAFLHAYAIFDKIGYLLNDYWRLGRPVQSVSFSNVWFSHGQQKSGIDERFLSVPNWPMRGLFWVSRDLCFSRNATHPLDPQARHLYHVRNHIAHKYLKVHDSLPTGWADRDALTGDEISLSVTSSELFSHSLKLLKLGRSALIYLALGAQLARQHEVPDDDGLIASMPLWDIEDDYRI